MKNMKSIKNLTLILILVNNFCLCENPFILDEFCNKKIDFFYQLNKFRKKEYQKKEYEKQKDKNKFIYSSWGTFDE
jgi:hypothetical protein